MVNLIVHEGVAFTAKWSTPSVGLRYTDPHTPAEHCLVVF